MKFVLDTNVVIYALRQPGVEKLPDGLYFYSVITEIELLSWPDITAHEETIFRSFLSRMQPIALDAAVTSRCIALRRDHRLKLPDAMVAASAQVNDAVLLTNDMRLHAIPGLICRAVLRRTGGD